MSLKYEPATRPSGGEAMGDALMENVTLRELRLNGNILGDVAMRRFAVALRTPPL